MDRKELLEYITKHLDSLDSKTLAFTATQIFSEIVDYDVNTDEFIFESTSIIDNIVDYQLN